MVVSNEGNLPPDMQCHITCQQIRANIHELPIANFEELLWLPDDGNGAWFYVGETAKETTCWADWSDEPIVNANRTLPSWAKVVRTRQVDLDCDIPSWLDERS